MKTTFNSSFTKPAFSLSFIGVDRFRFLLKGWGLKVLSLLLVVMVGGKSWGQTPNGILDFGTTANNTTATTANTGFGGVRVGTGGGGFTIQNPGQSIGANGELKGIAPTSGSINSVGITSTEYGANATTFTISFELHLSGGSSGTWYFFAGNGTSFGTAQSTGFMSAHLFTGISWAFGASSAITTNNRVGANWSAVGLSTPFAQGTSYFVTIVGNNSGSSVSYGASNAYSVAANKQDLWVNGTLVGNDLAKGELANNTSINAFRFYSESSTSNVATIALDNIRWYNTCTLPPTHLALISVPTTGTVGSNLTSFTAEARSGSTAGPVANSFTGAITVAKVSGAGSISGTTAPNATAGVATYSNIQFSLADTYTINATAAAPIVNASTSGDIIVSSSTSVPLAPTITSITPGNQQLSVAFTAGGNGGSAITNYKYSTNGGASFSACSPEQTSSPILITGLTNGTSYNVQIKAVNAIGDGTATSSTAAIPVTTPSAPTITSITPGNQELSVAFTAGATGGSVITNYKYSTDGGSTFTAVSPSQTNSPIVFTTLSTNGSTSLTNGTTYDVQIKAVNAQGDGSATATTQGTPTAAAVAPGAPTITSITPSNGQLSVVFTAGATGGSAITNYKYSIDGGSTFTTVFPATTSSPITINGLSNGTSYNVQIKAVNAIGDGAATASTVATPATTPSAPSITLITPSNGQLSVTFTSGATGGSAITNYKYSIDGGSTFIPLSPNATTSPITITGLSNGTSYNVQIKAVNVFGDGIATASTTATPITTPGAPTIGTATAGNGQATVTFTAPASNGGSVITSYSVTSSPVGGAGSLNQAGSGTIIVTGLTNGTAYTFTVKANNAAGASAASTASNSVTPILPAPVANAATNVLTNGFTANWDAVTGATGYKLDVSTISTNFSNVVSWSFPNNPDDATADGGVNTNTSKIITVGGAVTGLNFNSAGATTNSANSTGWNSGNGSKYWEVDFSTVGHYNTRISSKLRGSNTGPRDFKLQYKLGSVGTYADVPSSNITAANDYTTGVLYQLVLPSECDNQTSVYLRWIMTSNTSINGGTVASGGSANIDDILVEGNASSFVSGYQDLTVNSTSQTVTGLTENTTYYYRVRTTDANTTTANSNVITVTTKQTPTVTPTIGTYTYTGSPQGPSAATNSGTGTSYTFSYSGSGTITYGPSSTQPTAAGTYTVTASVAANGNYVAASSSATAFSIAKASSTITTAPTASGIVLGQALSVSSLSGGAATPTGGTFAFTSPSTVPSATGSYSASVTYTPSDVDNYNTTTTNVNVSVIESLSTFSNTQFTTDRNITRGTTELPIYRFKVDVTNAAATLSSLGFTTPATAANGNSNYVNTDITNFKAFLTTSTTFSNATPLGSTSPSGKTQQNAGETLINFTSLATTLNVGTTYYIWLTADVLSTAIAGRTIIVDEPTIGITGTVSGTNLATGTQTIIGVPTNYYLNTGGSLTTSSNYFTSPNGAGTSLYDAGLTYASNDVILNIPVSVTNTSDFTLGNGSKIVVQNGGSLTVGASNTITGTIDVNDGGTLTVNNTTILHTLGTLGTTSSTVIYSTNGNQTVAAKPYANLTISGGNTKTLAGAASVSGTLTINGTVLALGSNNLSPANLTLDGLGTRNGTWGSTSSSATYKNNSYFSGSGLVTVTNNTALTPSISGVTASQSITYGAASITLTGTVSATGPVYPANGETVSVTINGNTQTTTTTGGNGAFSITYTCNTIPYSATPYDITYAYAGNGFLNAASETSTSLTISKADQYITFASTNSVFNTVADYNPGATSASSGINAITYTSSNTAVATIVSGNIHVTGVGQTTITASQASSDNYNAASATQTLTVNAYTSIITQPVGYTILATGATPTALSVTAIGTNLSYQWYSNTTNSTSNGVAINLATSANYTPPSTSGAMYYYVVVHGDYGSDVTSNVVAVVISDIFTWNGSVSTDWNTAANWTPAGVPIATANVSVPNLTNNPEIDNLTIASNGSVTLASGTALTLSGTITNNGTFTIESGATLVQGLNSQISGNGTFSVLQNVTGTSTGNFRSYYLGSPLNSTSSSVFSPITTNNLLYNWNANTTNPNWYQITNNSTSINPGVGYLARFAQPTTLNFSGLGSNGVFFNNAPSNNPIQVPCYRQASTSYQGFNLVSNPFPSYLDWNDVYTANSTFSSTIWYRIANGSNAMVFDTYNATAGAGTNTSGLGDASRYVAPMQSFWVRIPSGGPSTANLSFSNSMREHYMSGEVAGLRSSSQDFPAFLRLNLVQGNTLDQIIVYMKPDASSAFDSYDSEKMFLSGTPQLYSKVLGKSLVINGMRNNKKKTSVPLSLDLPTTGLYFFQAEEYNIEDGLIILEDKQENVFQDLTLNNTYSFYHSSGTVNDRFVIHFHLPDASITAQGPSNIELVDNDIHVEEAPIEIASNGNGKVIVSLGNQEKPEGRVQVLDASGRIIFESMLSDAETMFDLQTSAGIYYVKVSTATSEELKKIVLQP
jgi:predicted RNA-binding protein with TRAM domain